MLEWIVCATRPLTLTELREAVATKIGQDAVMGYIDDLDGLVKLADQDQTVALADQSVKDYLLRQAIDVDTVLESFRIVEAKAHARIAQRCAEYLRTPGCLDKGPVNPRHPSAADTVKLNQHPLLSYSVRFWPMHARLSDPDLIINWNDPFFYGNNRMTLVHWLSSYEKVDYFANGRPSNLMQIAAYFGIWGLARNIIKKKRNWLWRRSIMNNANSYGKTPLWFAVSEGHEALVQLLLGEGGAEVDKRRFDNENTPLSEAAARGHLAMVRLLVDKGASIDIHARNGMTPLHEAAGKGHEAMVQLLLSKGAAINPVNQWFQTPLRLAIEGGHEPIVRLLLDRGAVLQTYKNRDGNTPPLMEEALRIAVERGHQAVMQLLLERGAPVNILSNDYLKDDKTLLHMAAAGGHDALIQVLLNLGLDVNSKNKYCERPLHLAAHGGHEAAARLLLSKGAILDARDKYDKTPLHEAETGDYKALPVMRLLLERGAAVNARDKWGRTPLLSAAGRRFEAAARVLLKNGADVNAANAKGETPLHKAARAPPWGDLEMVRLLLDHGALMNVKDGNGDTPLWMAAGIGGEAVVQLLLDRGAAIDTHEWDSSPPRTPMRMAKREWMARRN
jgi:ankyrin repeat protein